MAVRWDGGDVLYRLVRSDPPGVRDFKSSGAKGLPTFNPRNSFLLHLGLSMFESEHLARGRARGPTFLAEVHLREGLGFYVAKTLSEGHFTVWGDPSALLSTARVIDRIV